MHINEMFSEGWGGRMPSQYLRGLSSTSGGPGESLGAVPSAPILVFVNAGSGGHLGERLADCLERALTKDQVYRVGKECNPERILQQIWENFDVAIKGGDTLASDIRSKTRLIACGGDGTISWVLNCIRKLELKPSPPPAAVIPLGTGNGLSINFGWGKTTRANWVASDDFLLKELQGIAEADIREIDLWDIKFNAPSEEFYDKNDLPAALSVQEDASKAASERVVTLPAELVGRFCYYFTFGLDAEGAYRFDHLRKNKPHLTKKRKVNIFWYMWFIIRTGWFCGASPLNEKIAKLQVKDKKGNWTSIEIADSVRALIIINLQTYSGGRDVWGLRDERPEEGKEKGFVSPIFDDGLIEVVGLEGGYKSWAALSGVHHNLHGKRVAQASEIRIVYHSPKEKKGVAMRMDGEPWWQNLPSEEGKDIVVAIKHAGTARMLINTELLPGATKKLMAIAQRETQLSQPSSS